METALQKQEQPIFALTINEFKAQLAEMDKFIAECLIPDSEPGKCDGDYGIIPGCGDKPTLHQPGVDKLSRLFSLVPDFEIIEKEASDKLVRYVLKCRVSINDIFIGAGLGACSTAESKYHKALNKIDFVVEWEATAEQKATGKRVKKQSKKGTDYWVYEVAITLPAYELENTIIKMAAVRAKRAAVITATRLHHKFTQDLEDMNHRYEKPEEVDAEVVENEPTSAQFDMFTVLKEEIPKLKTAEGVQAWGSANKKTIDALPESMITDLRNLCYQRKMKLQPINK